MFCPNCGAQNPDNATTCQKCGFAIRAAGGPKFKGTMLMMNTPGGLVPGAANAGTPPPGAVPPAAPAPGDAPQAARQRLKGTMIGVAPPAFGGLAQPPPSLVQPPAAQLLAAPPPAGQSPVTQPQVQPGAPEAAPVQAQAARGYGALSPTAAMPAIAAPDTSAMAAFDAPAQGHLAPGAINPLGGTLVASPTGPEPWATQTAGSAQAAGFGGRPSGDIPIDMRDSAVLDAGPANAQLASYGNQHYGAGAEGRGYEGVPPTQPGGNSQAGFAAAGGLAGFTERPAWRVALLMLLTIPLPLVNPCGIYGVLWFAWTADELRAKGHALSPSWHLIIPILNIVWVWRWCAAVERVSNAEQSAATSFLLLLLVGPVGGAVLQSKLNEL